MSSRVIGRGVCPRCGREGSVVLKQIGDRIYVYFKHGRKWCYVGPLERVDLSNLLLSIGYPTPTTKMAGALQMVLGALGMRRSLLQLAIMILVALAYSLSTNPSYSNIVLSLMVIAWILSSYGVSQHQGKLCCKFRELKAHQVLAILLGVAGLLVGMSLTSPVILRVEIPGASSTHVFELPLTCFLLASIILGVTAHCLRSRRDKLIVYALAPLITMLILSLPILTDLALYPGSLITLSIYILIPYYLTLLGFEILATVLRWTSINRL